MQEQVKNQKHADGTPAKKMEAHEAANANQARGMDTQAMIPVLAMIAELLSITLFRWVSVPDLKYTPYSTVEKYGSWRTSPKAWPGTTRRRRA